VPESIMDEVLARLAVIFE